MDEEMTNRAIEILIKAIIRILRDDNVSEETIKKIEDLLK